MTGKRMAQAKLDKNPVGEKRIEAIYRALFDAILAQELAPGTKLSEETIGDFFGVSRTVVRAVFNRLQSNALIDLKQNRGAFVASPTVEESRQLFRARICIEREIAWRLAETITDDKLRQLEDLLDKERKAHHVGDNPKSIALSGEFHLLAARMAGNDVLTQFLSQLITRTSLVLALYGRHNSSDCGIDEHQTIIDALRDRDPARAADAMAAHLEDIIERSRLSESKQEPRKLAEILSRYAT